jgi:hypothetical protein
MTKSGFELIGGVVAPESAKVVAALCAQRGLGVWGGDDGDVSRLLVSAVDVTFELLRDGSTSVDPNALLERMTEVMHPDWDLGPYHNERAYSHSAVLYALEAAIDSSEAAALANAEWSAKAEVSIADVAYYLKHQTYDGYENGAARTRILRQQIVDLELGASILANIEDRRVLAIGAAEELAGDLRSGRWP